MEPDQNQLASLFPSIASQMRGALSNLHLAASQLISANSREENPEFDTQAAMLDQSYYQLLRLVNSLSSAKYLLESTPFPLKNRDLVSFVGSICERSAGLASLLDLELRFVCPMYRHVVAINPDALEQLVYHLLSNAFKFTPSGGSVTVELQARGKWVMLSVTDTGCGISEERLPALFDRYLHPESKDPAPHGLGLGLPLCRCIARGHGGALMAESSVGKGSRFIVSLPDRQVDGGVSDVPFDYTGGFNPTLLGLADALPARAFLLRSQK